MPSWPSIAVPSAIREGHFKRQIRTPFESGYVQSRPGATSARKWFSLSWRFMSQADLDSLLTFFDSNQGGTFDWTHPETSTAYTARFSGDSVDYTWVRVGRWQVSVEIEED